MIIFIILLIVSLFIFILLDIVIKMAKLYENVEKTYIDIFVIFRKRKEYLLDTYQNDLALIEFYDNLLKLDLNNRLKEEFNLKSIDDNFDDYLLNAKAKLNDYLYAYHQFNEYIKSHDLLYKFMAYKPFIDLSYLTYHQ